MILTVFQLQNRFAPLPRNLHIIFAVAATVLFLVLYLRNKKLSDLLWMLVLDTTVILQFFGDPITATAVGIVEVILIALLIWTTNKESKEEKARIAAEMAAEADPMDELDERVKSERKAIIDDNKVDVIQDAFEGEDWSHDYGGNS